MAPVMLLLTLASTPPDTPAVVEAKREILKLAESYAGQGDPDRSKQRALDVLVQKLLRASPQQPVRDRLPLLQGAWKQVWGPYDYRGNRRGVDPSIGVDEIYQVVFEKGFYYNVSPDYKKGDKTKESIGLLRGQYELDPRNENLLRVRFTNLYGLKKRPAKPPLWDLPALAEAGQLAGRSSPLPGFLVKLFFGGGALREVYTDADLRITYGSDGKNLDDDYLYVMTRVKPASR